MENRQIGRNLFILNNKMKRLLDKYHQKNGLYLSQARLLTYLYRRQEDKIYQKDIEHAFQIRGGTVTGMIDSLIKLNLIERLESTTDKRKRKIVLTNLGLEKSLEALKTINDFELLIENSMTIEELTIFEDIIRRINNIIDVEETR